jgi:hypothetical protein
VRVFAARADETIVTKMQQTGGTFPAAWTTVPGLVAVGSPSAVLSPITGKIEVVARDAVGRIWSTGEVTPASGTWRAWAEIPSQTVASATDPRRWCSATVRAPRGRWCTGTPTGARTSVSSTPGRALRWPPHRRPAPGLIRA